MSYWSNLKVTGQPGRRQAPVKGASTNHRGMDVIFPDGKIRPEVNGTVYYSGNMDGYGNIIIIKGDDGNYYHYAHNAANRVKKGQRVNAGEVIGTMGNTGTSSGPHTHIEVTNANGVNLHPQTKQNLGIGGNKLASQGFYTGAAAPIEGQVYTSNSPGLVDPTQDIGNIGTQSLGELQRLSDEHRALINALSNDPRYDITRQMQQADVNLQQVQNQGLADVNQQAYQNVMSPQEMMQRADESRLANDVAEAQAKNVIDKMYAGYQARPDAEQNAEFLRKQQEAMNQGFINASPVLQQYYNGQGGNQGLYNVNPQELQRRIDIDNEYNRYLQNQALTYAKNDPRTSAVFMQMAQNNPGTAGAYLQNAQAQYEANMASKYGVPYQQLMEQSKAMQDYQKAYAPNLMAGQKEAMIQPEMNYRSVAEKVIPTAENMYKDKVQATNNYLTALQNADTNYIKANQPGADLIAKTAEQRGKLQVEQPQRILDKYRTQITATGIPTTPQMQGTTSIGTNMMTNVTKNAGDINKVQSDIYKTETTNANTQKANEIKEKQLIAKNPNIGLPMEELQKAEEQKLRSQDAEKVNKYILSEFTGRPDPTRFGMAKQYLMSTGRYTNEQANAILQMAYTQAQVNNGKNNRRKK